MLVRKFYSGVTLIGFIFIFTILFILSATAILAWMPLPLIGEMRDWISQVWSLAGMRAILLGVALGAIMTGLRVLMGADRPYEG